MKRDDGPLNKLHSDDWKQQQQKPKKKKNTVSCQLKQPLIRIYKQPINSKLTAAGN